MVVNGPERSIILLRTLNWKSGKGSYEIEQYFTAYKNKYYSTCQVKFLEFTPEENATEFGCGIRAIMNEYNTFIEDGTIISFGKDVAIESPSPDEVGKEKLRTVLDFEGIALVVKDKYKPSYQFVKSYGGNHTFHIPVTDNLSFEYLFAGAWSEGLENTTEDEFKTYVSKAAEEFNNPLEISGLTIEEK